MVNYVERVQSRTLLSSILGLDETYYARPLTLPAPAPLAEVQHNASWNPTPQLDMRKTKSKQQHNEHTADKTTLIAQDILTTRVAMQEKDNVIDLLKNKVSGQ